MATEPTTITVFSTNNCPYCKLTSNKLTEKGVPFTYINMEDPEHAGSGPDGREWIDVFRDKGYRSAPIVTFGDPADARPDDGYSWCGPNPVAIMKAKDTMERFEAERGGPAASIEP